MPRRRWGLSARSRRRTCGGYGEFRAALADPLHEEHDNYVAWVGYEFDPSDFNVAGANAALQRVR
jgi:Plasmid pRiA4b ORF-3-like protein